ncbi:MAG: sulfotransferase family protein [Gammaproteobacteria bacterium]|nr:sulfotransferase family protein [Gammaproteobacteria bacterium]
MSLKIIGASFGRTASLSLKKALEILGYTNCYHMSEVVTKPEHSELWLRAWKREFIWDDIFDGYQAAVDWPVAAFWPQLMEAYPEAKIILSTREPEAWYESAKNTIFKSMDEGINSKNQAIRKRILMAKEIIVDGTFNGKLNDKKHCIKIYNENIARCKKEVDSDRLITFNPKDGWDSLCKQLACPIPNVDYPFINTTKEFEARWRSRKNPAD